MLTKFHINADKWASLIMPDICRFSCLCCHPYIIKTTSNSTFPLTESESAWKIALVCVLIMLVKGRWFQYYLVATGCRRTSSGRLEKSNSAKKIQPVQAENPFSLNGRVARFSFRHNTTQRLPIMYNEEENEDMKMAKNGHTISKSMIRTTQCMQPRQQHHVPRSAAFPRWPDHDGRGCC